MRKNTGLVKALMVIAALVICSTFSLGLKVFPTLTDLGESYDKEQSFILTILNDGPKTEEVGLIIEAESTYLAEYVTIEPTQFTLKTNSKQNVQVTTDFPGNLSPEKHRLVIKPLSRTNEGEKTVYTFTVPGVARPDLRIVSLGTEDVKKGNSLAFTIELNNLGNVIARAQPTIEIYREGDIVDDISYESTVQVMPFSKYNITLLYDTSSLDEGSYEAKAVMTYNDNLKTNEFRAGFEVAKASLLMPGGSFFSRIKYPAVLILSLVLLLLALKPKFIKGALTRHRYPSQVLKKIEDINMRTNAMESDIRDLVRLSQDFIQESNQFFEYRFGKGRFEFK